MAHADRMKIVANDEEPLRKDASQVKDGRILYHYCGMDALMGIIKSKSLWLSDITKSNDSGELRHTMKIAEARTVQRLQEICPPDLRSTFTGEVLQKILHSVLPAIEWRYYAICFSLVPDLLSQWRCYADDAAGCAIGFSESALVTDAAESNFPDFQIIANMYDVKYADTLCVDWLDTIGECANLDEYSDRILDIAEAYVFGSCSTKSLFFSEEREVRYLARIESLVRPAVVVRPADPIPVRIETNNDSAFCGKELATLGVNARYSDGRIVGYLDFSFKECPNQAVREIVLGPKCKASVEDIRTLLAIEGFDPSSVVVQRSVGTYR